MRDLVRAPSASGMSVRDDWRACLPKDSGALFNRYVQQQEIAYNMLSVSLDEVLSLRQNQLFGKAGQAVAVTADLCSRFANPLSALLWSLGEHAKHYGTVPNAVPLNPANFQGSRTQRVARFHSLLCRVLLSQRAQFLHKTSTLGDMVADLCQDFCSSAAEIAERGYLASDSLWDALDTAHYDLNTCLREAIILLKSFLMALPSAELPAFQATVGTQMAVTPPTKAAVASRLIRRRRMVSIGGE